ncbi:DNA cytosine methyltransferase [Streptomyces sp. DT203]|uniref:DNA cytosine methyltransferase n=1 Tax=Streptomyces sp. DT203 TaxID=3393424 RepID=UPI003CE85320
MIHTRQETGAADRKPSSAHVNFSTSAQDWAAQERDFAGKYELVTLFAGAGAWDLAARDLGEPSVGIERDKDTCATRRAAGLATEKGDVREFSPSDFPAANVLVGGPPCNTYSAVGAGAGRRALTEVQHFIQRMAQREDVRTHLVAQQARDERASLVLEPLRWALTAVDAGHPYQAVVLIQVPTVLPDWRAMAEVLCAEGYSVTSGVLRAEEFGVPQTRRRAGLIARRHGVAKLPQPTHQSYRRITAASNDPQLPPCVTMGETLSRPAPFHVVSNYGSGGDPKARGRRTSEEPAATVTGKFSRTKVTAMDGTELERLTCAEAGQLQSFPTDYPWSGGDRGQQIGNATPPLLATHILTAALV